MKLKRLLALVCCGVLMCLPLTGCKSDGAKKIRLSEVTHSIFYAPLYVAINNGYFKDYGIKIELSNGGGSDKVMTAITSKSADIGLTGPETTIYVHNEGQKDYPVIFGQLTKRDGSFLVSKKAEPDFKWADTAGKHVLAGRPGGVPAMTLQYVMNQAGVPVTTDDPNFDTAVAFNMMVPAFEGDKNGLYDYCTMFEPTASEFVKAGKGYIVSSVGESSGEVPYTAFLAKKSYIEENKDLVTDFLRAVVKGYNYMINNPAAEVAKALAPSFDATGLDSLEATVKSYVNIDAWNATPVMKKEAFERLQDIMENAGVLSQRAVFEEVVNNTIAETVAAELLK